MLNQKYLITIKVENMGLRAANVHHNMEQNSKRFQTSK